MVYVNNYNSVKNVLGTTQARQFIHQFTLRIRKILPEGALCCRDREDLFIIAFDGMYAEKDVDWYSALLASVFVCLLLICPANRIYLLVILAC